MVYTLTTDSPRRRKKRAARIEQILDSAMQILSEDGFAGLTIHRLAAELDVTPGAFYRYFRSKEEIFANLVRRVVDELDVVLREAVGRAESFSDNHELNDVDRAILGIVALAKAYRLMALERPEEYYVVRLSFGHSDTLVPDDELARPLLEHVMVLFEFVGELLHRTAHVGAISSGSGSSRGITLWSSLQGILQMEKLGRFHAGSVVLVDLFDGLTRTLLLGWGASPENLTKAKNYLAELEAEAPLSSASTG